MCQFWPGRRRSRWDRCCYGFNDDQSLRIGGKTWTVRKWSPHSKIMDDSPIKLQKSFFAKIIVDLLMCVCTTWEVVFFWKNMIPITFDHISKGWALKLFASNYPCKRELNFHKHSSLFSSNYLVIKSGLKMIALNLGTAKSHLKVVPLNNASISFKE